MCILASLGGGEGGDTSEMNESDGDDDQKKVVSFSGENK